MDHSHLKYQLVWLSINYFIWFQNVLHEDKTSSDYFLLAITNCKDLKPVAVHCSVVIAWCWMDFWSVAHFVIMSDNLSLTGLSSLVSQPMYSATVIIWSTIESISSWSRNPFLSVSYIRNITTGKCNNEWVIKIISIIWPLMEHNEPITVWQLTFQFVLGFASLQKSEVRTDFLQWHSRTVNIRSFTILFIWWSGGYHIVIHSLKVFVNISVQNWEEDGKLLCIYFIWLEVQKYFTCNLILFDLCSDFSVDK